MWLGGTIATSVGLVCWSLWVRRHTWSNRWTTPLTVSIALQGATVLLLSPLTAATLGSWLYRHTGRWNLESCLGHVCWLLALGALAYSALVRLGNDEVFRRKLNQMVVLPLTVAIPTLLGLFCSSPAVAAYSPDILDIPVDLALEAYWLVLCVVAGHLLAYTGRALLVLRRSPRHRSTATAYLLTCGLGIAAVVTQAIVVIIPALNTPATTFLVWVIGGGMVACCALVGCQGVSAAAARRRAHSGPTTFLAGPSASP